MLEKLCWEKSCTFWRIYIGVWRRNGFDKSGEYLYIKCTNKYDKYDDPTTLIKHY